MRWPHGARSAAVLAFDLDGPTGAAMIDGSIWRQTTRFVEGGYGPFAALPRLLAVLAETGSPATFFVPAWVVEHWPQAVTAIVESGHEIAHHGYRHEKFLDLSVEEQREVIDRSQLVFERVLGRRAVGFRTPTGDWSAVTPSVLVEAGFRYSSSMRDSHTPYMHTIDGSPTSLVEIPARVDLDDYAYFAYSRDPDYPSSGDRIASYRVVRGNLRREAEGFHAVGGCLITTFHPKVIGTPGRARLVAELTRHLAEARDVWLATADDVARHVSTTVQDASP